MGNISLFNVIRKTIVDCMYRLIIFRKIKYFIYFTESKKSKGRFRWTFVAIFEL